MRSPRTVRGPLDLGLSTVRMHGEVSTLAKGEHVPRVDKESTTVTEKSEGTAGTTSPGGSKTTAASKSTAKKTAKTSSTAGTKKAAANKSAKTAAKSTAAKTTTAASKKTVEDIDTTEEVEPAADALATEESPAEATETKNSEEKEKNAAVAEAGGFIVSDTDEEDAPAQQVVSAGATADPVKDYLKQI